jgi:enamine deaminase RidA (YjgF/YER057c/UK114 family)
MLITALHLYGYGRKLAPLSANGRSPAVITEPVPRYRSIMVTRINPPGLAAPSGFSHAVRATGEVVWLAGQTGTDPTGRIVAGGLVAQFEQALSNLVTALRAAGGQPDQLAKVTIYIVDVPAYKAASREIGAVWRRIAGSGYPAMAGIGVARLWDDEALVEIEGFAVLD